MPRRAQRAAEQTRTLRLPVPLGRSVPADEVDAAVAFLLEPDAGYVQGCVLFVDDGTHVLMYPASV